MRESLHFIHTAKDLGIKVLLIFIDAATGTAADDGALTNFIGGLKNPIGESGGTAGVDKTYTFCKSGNTAFPDETAGVSSNCDYLNDPDSYGISHLHIRRDASSEDFSQFSTRVYSELSYVFQHRHRSFVLKR